MDMSAGFTLALIAQAHKEEERQQQTCHICGCPIIFTENNHRISDAQYEHLFPCVYGPRWANVL